MYSVSCLHANAKMLEDQAVAYSAAAAQAREAEARVLEAKAAQAKVVEVRAAEVKTAEEQVLAAKSVESNAAAAMSDTKAIYDKTMSETMAAERKECEARAVHSQAMYDYNRPVYHPCAYPACYPVYCAPLG